MLVKKIQLKEDKEPKNIASTILLLLGLIMVFVGGGGTLILGLLLSLSFGLDTSIHPTPEDNIFIPGAILAVFTFVIGIGVMLRGVFRARTENRAK